VAEPQIFDDEMLEEPVASIEQVTETIENDEDKGITEEQLKQLLS